MSFTKPNKAVQPEVNGLCDAWPRDSTNLKLPMALARQTRQGVGSCMVLEDICLE